VADSSIADRCRKIELLLSDVDGVLNDGVIILDDEGAEIKQFHIRDGLGIKLWQHAGHRFGLVTGRASQILKMRAAELGIEIVRQGVADKWPAVCEILKECKLDPDRAAFIGDDLLDLPVLSRVGLALTVADAGDDVRRAAHFTTTRPGGRGAVREAIEMILKAQNRWEKIVDRFRQ
jgi:3-deoxy-D-manno-octulosonate 8-phosphate phosphatase (KDO 8-P phosphatase)